MRLKYPQIIFFTSVFGWLKSSLKENKQVEPKIKCNRLGIFFFSWLRLRLQTIRARLRKAPALQHQHQRGFVISIWKKAQTDTDIVLNVQQRILSGTASLIVKTSWKLGQVGLAQPCFRENVVKIDFRQLYSVFCPIFAKINFILNIVS